MIYEYNAKAKIKYKLNKEKEYKNIILAINKIYGLSIDLNGLAKQKEIKIKAT